MVDSGATPSPTPLAAGAMSEDLAETAGPVPKVVLLFHRLEFDWYNPILMRELRERYGTRFILVLGSRKLERFARDWCVGDDQAIYLDELTASARASAAEATPDAAYEEARAVERALGLVYFRDVIQQDRSRSAHFLQYAPNSAHSRPVAQSYAELIAELNAHHRYFEALIAREGVDLIVERPGGVASNIAIHIGIKRAIPITYTLAARHKSYVMWSHGPYLGHGLLRERMTCVADAEPVPENEVAPPADSAGNIAKIARLRSLRSLAVNWLRTTLIRVRMMLDDLRHGRRGQRLSYWRVMWQHLSVFRSFRFLERNSTADMDALRAQPFVLFLLQLEPEFTTLSLARGFNDTSAFVRMLAMSLPAGYRLVVKEHATSIGNRSFKFYEDMLRLPNVVMADYQIRGVDLIRHAEAVSTVSGTAAQEAALFGKRAIIFAQHVEYGFMPHVRTVDRLADLPDVVREAIAERDAGEVDRIKRDAARYRLALESVAFNAPGVRTFRGDATEIAPDQEAKSIETLLATYRRQKAAYAARLGFDDVVVVGRPTDIAAAAGE